MDNFLEFYKLRENPFGFTPDPAFLFPAETHREALAWLQCGIEFRCGFVALIAEPGLGKTTLLLETLKLLQDKFATVFLSQTISSPQELLRAILAELGVSVSEESLVGLQAKLGMALAEKFRLGTPVVVVMDEAQNLDDSVLEFMRMLSDFETQQDKLIQIVLCGQPQLAEKISSPALEKLKQRVAISARLDPLSADDTARYIDHRLRTAGYTWERPLFTDEAVALIAENSAGVPRNINNLCFNSLKTGYALKRSTIDGETIREVVHDLDPVRLGKESTLVVPPEAPGYQDMPFLASMNDASRSTNWAFRFVIGLVLALVLVGVLFTAHPLKFTAHPLATSGDRTPPYHGSASTSGLQEVAPPGSARDSKTVDAPQDRLSSPPSLEGRDQNTKGAGTVSAVRVLSGKALQVICTKDFASCDVKSLDKVDALKPALAAADHIETGSGDQPAGTSLEHPR